MNGVSRIVADQCQLGQHPDSGEPLKKPTGFMLNAPELLRSSTGGALGATVCARDSRVGDTPSASARRRDARTSFGRSFASQHYAASGRRCLRMAAYAMVRLASSPSPQHHDGQGGRDPQHILQLGLFRCTHGRLAKRFVHRRRDRGAAPARVVQGREEEGYRLFQIQRRMGDQDAERGSDQDGSSSHFREMG